MTTTDTPTDVPTDFPPPPGPPPAPPRVLRRSRSDRVAAGVSGGLGDYFGVDPVLFRVLFAVSAFFGGAGILAYLVAWAAIPETGTERAPIDGMIAELRRRGISPWVVAVGAGLLLWLVSFSWWAPGPFVPIVAVVVIFAIIFGRRDLQGRQPYAGDGRVDLTKPATAQPGSPAGPAWLDEGRAWFDEAREASRRRRRRALPVKLTALGVLVVTLAVLAAVDATTGIALPVYLWVTLGIVGVALLTGIALRRTPWGLTALLVIAGAGLVAFAGSHASLHDGVGTRDWKPTVRPATQYRLAIGKGVLDLRNLPEQATPRTIHVTMAVGQVRVLTRRDANVAFSAKVRFGLVETREGSTVKISASGSDPGYDVPAPTGATGARTTVVVQLADGYVELARD